MTSSGSTPLAQVRAVRFDRYGGRKVLSVRDIPTPRPGPGEVLVEVRAAGINRRGGRGRPTRLAPVGALHRRIGLSRGDLGVAVHRLQVHPRLEDPVSHAAAVNGSRPRSTSAAAQRAASASVRHRRARSTTARSTAAGSVP